MEKTVAEQSTASAASRPKGAIVRRHVLIIEDDTLVGLGLRSHLEKMGHHVVGQAASSGEAIEMFRKHKPDLALVDVRLDGADGIDLAGRLLAERPCPMIVVSAYGDAELVSRAGTAGVYGYLIKPASRESLAAQIEIAVRRFDEREQLRGEKQQLSQTLESRKSVEKAKGIVMKRMGLEEPAAHRWLQLECQKRRISIGDLAKEILNTPQQG
jgi:AmiR/NasT family two-component response regulator